MSEKLRPGNIELNNGDVETDGKGKEDELTNSNSAEAHQEPQGMNLMWGINVRNADARVDDDNELGSLRTSDTKPPTTFSFELEAIPSVDVTSGNRVSWLSASQRLRKESNSG
jgi:hypothetical protein